MLVGEAWGEKEEEQQRPFVGTSGYLLDQFLSQVGIDRRDCYVTNVFNLRPRPNNDVSNLCGKKPEGIAGYPALTKGKFALAKYQPELERLYDEIKRERPNLIVALGATAAWALLKSTGIKQHRGFVASTHEAVSAKIGYSAKVLPTYHPAAVARQWELRPVILADLDKAKRESTHADIIRPARLLWIEPTLEDLATYEREYILPAEILSADIETWGQQITCIGFAPSASSGIVIPFVCENNRRGGTDNKHSYWPTIEEELIAWDYVARWLTLRPTIFQNGMYDIQFLYRSYGIPVPLAAEDTMLLHHAFQPELEKGLGFLASIYTDEAAWKFMRKGTAHD